MPFARTKIQWPRLRAGQQVERPALQQALAEALATQRLVLVCAPAGYGKTSALAQQAVRLAQTAPEQALAWVALDDSDDLPHLLECLIGALEPHDPPWRIAPEALVAMAEAGVPPAQIGAELVNTLDACDTPHGLIVLDDLHRLSDAPALAFLSHLVERLSPRWTLAVTTRHEPALPVARLRALGELAEFRLEALRFSPDEARALAQCLGQDEAAAAGLHARTEGWPAGLRLALNAGARSTPGAIDRHVFDFLAAEVIDQLDDELREFLLAISVLPELEPARCAEVSGNPRAAQLLAEVERRGLFATAVDGEAGTLRLHDLFRQALAQCLVRRHPERVPQLLRRAAAAEPDPQQRIALLLRADAPEQAAEVLAAHGGRWLTEGAVHTVQRTLAQFAPAVRAESAALQIVSAQLAWARWDFTAMVQAAEQAVALAAAQPAQHQRARAYLALALNAQGRVDDGAAVLGPLRREALDDETRILALVASGWHALDMGSLHRVGPVLDEMLLLLERTPRIEYWYMATPLSRFHGLPDTADALRRHAAGVRRLTGDTPTALSAVARLTEAWLAVWTGRLDEADVLVANADDDCRWVGDPINVRRMVRQQQALMHALRGRHDAALELARFPLQRQVDHGSAWSAWQSVFLSARVAVVCGDAPLLRDCLAALDPSAVAPSARALAARARPQLALPGHLSWLEGRADEAIAHWQAALAHEEQIDVLGQAAELRLYLAWALLRAGRDAEAAATLAPAIARAQREHGPGGLLFARAPLAALMEPALRARLPQALAEPLARWARLSLGRPAHGGEPVDPARLAGADETLDGDLDDDLDHGLDEDGDGNDAPPGAGLALPAAHGAAPAGQTTAVGRAGLSPREVEVLQRIAAGDSNKLIARVFDLSPHTVKRHVANVLGKLGVASRGQAAAWWRDHGLR
ncbi:LuxR C-terminal-related transcriptional regulator [Ideonella sp. DXS22W]|uniref:LuxR C-terminal-related transcriptional regulator n=1 Tax=Pseudaquabacterium inlustre TaxID=2984192 RepID=A0ABU9CB39_9BURK